MVAEITSPVSETGSSGTSAHKVPMACGSCGGAGYIWVYTADVGVAKIQCHCRRSVKNTESSTVSDWWLIGLVLLAIGLVIKCF